MKYYVVDVFTDKIFSGNPAGVCVLNELDEWLPVAAMQNIAMENNLSETAFLVKRSGFYDLRWFTPTMEVDLCGHATMGSAYVLFKFYEPAASVLAFHTQSGILSVERKGEMLLMDMPSRPAAPTVKYDSIVEALGIVDFEIFKSEDLLVVLGHEETVRAIQPDFERLMDVQAQADMPGDNFSVIITAPGADCDFVSRVFAPNAGINEDPVTGSAHCVLIPYWSHRLGKKTMTARQLSKRGGMLWCEDAGERVAIGGQAALYMVGDIIV